MNDLGLGVVVSMKDAFTRNAQRIQTSMMSLDATVAAASERMTRNLDRIQKGTMMIGAGLATLAVPAALVASTAATQKALGELASLGVQDLRAIEDAAESFTNQWAGTSKAEFIGATYDVKSALSQLSDEAVGVFTSMAALTAKATKASTQEMVGTFTTGYGIFRPLMADMTDMQWASAFSGAMAQTVASFKTNGQQMAEAIKNIGAVAASANVPLQEQLAVLGQLQTTMPGAEAGTLYKAFMMKAAEAGDELGLSFTDSTGRLRAVTAILQEIRALYPDLSQAAAQVELKKAFGSDEALKFVLQMSTGMEALEGSIQNIEKAMRNGAAVTQEMARAMNLDIGARLALLRQQVANLFEILGRTLLPVVTPLVGALSQMVVFVQNVARAIPGLIRTALLLAGALGGVLVIAGAVMSAIGLIGVSAPAISAGVLAIAATASGVGAAIAAWFWPVTLAIVGAIAAVAFLRWAWASNFGQIQDTVMGVWNRVSLAFQGIRALATSLSAGVGQIPAELARSLEAAGLMGFVVTVFRVYHRVREFLGGMAEAFSHAFSRIRAILEPSVQALVSAYAALYQACFSIFEILGLVSTAANGSSFRTLGAAVATLLGVLLQVGAYVVRFVLVPLTMVVRTLAFVTAAGVWVGKVIVGALVRAGKAVGRFFLPLRLLGQALVSVSNILYALWQILTGDGSVLAGLRTIGSAVFDFLLTPFRWAHDVVAGLWALIRDMVTAIVDCCLAAAATVGQAIVDLPVIAALRQVIDTARNLLSGDGLFFESGQRMVRTLGDGIAAMAAYPYRKMKQALSGIRNLLPFSDAREGPLASLTASGAALLTTFAQGMSAAADLPTRAMRGAVAGLQSLWGRWTQSVRSPSAHPGPAAMSMPLHLVPRLDARLAPTVLRAALLLSPAIAGAYPVPSPILSPMTNVALEAATSGDMEGEAARQRLGPFHVVRSASTDDIQGRESDLRPLIQALLDRLDVIAHRPVQLAVTTQLDGRSIAEAVYKDLREQRIRNYETL